MMWCAVCGESFPWLFSQKTVENWHQDVSKQKGVTSSSSYTAWYICVTYRTVVKYHVGDKYQRGSTKCRLNPALLPLWSSKKWLPCHCKQHVSVSTEHFAFPIFILKLSVLLNKLPLRTMFSVYQQKKRTWLSIWLLCWSYILMSNLIQCNKPLILICVCVCMCARACYRLCFLWVSVAPSMCKEAAN
jgi:hypothetical protein